MKRQDSITTHDTQARAAGRSQSDARRSELVEEMVRGAILPRLLARKDAGHFDRASNVVRFPRRDEA